MKNKTVNIIVIIISACIFLWFFVFSNGITSLINVLKTVNIYWIIAAFLFMICFWIAETAVLYVIIKTIYTNIPRLFIKSIKFEMIGQFWGAITPLQSGSQAAQLYAMTKNEIPAGPAGSILMIKFIMHQVVLTLYSLIVLIFKFNYFSKRISYLLYFCILGFIFNSLLILIAVLFSINKNITKKIVNFFVFILGKFRIIKDTKKAFQKFENEMLSFHENAIIIAKNKKMCLNAIIFSFLQWTFFYSIPYFIYRSFGLNSIDIFTMISAQVFLMMITSCIPIPGASFGAEGGFYKICSLFFNSKTIMPSIFLWRTITYYSNIGIGSIFTIEPSSHNKRCK